MSARKAQLAGLAAILALTTAGCGLATDSSGAAPAAVPTSTKPLDPQAALVDAVPGDRDGAFRYEVTGGDLPTSGVLDAPHQALEIRISQHQTGPDFTLTMTARAVGKQTWVKMAITPAGLPGLPKIPKNWQLIDAAKLKGKDLPFGYDGSTDPGYALLLVQKATGIKEISPGHFAGTTDLTQSTEADIVDAKTLEKLGAKAKNVPFTATIDAKGNLTSLIAKVPAAGGVKAKTYSIKYGGFGATPVLAAPAPGEQQKATSVIYQMLAG
jgi:hypothetical protein